MAACVLGWRNRIDEASLVEDLHECPLGVEHAVLGLAAQVAGAR
jgi:hypothetical protein